MKEEGRDSRKGARATHSAVHTFRCAHPPPHHHTTTPLTLSCIPSPLVYTIVPQVHTITIDEADDMLLRGFSEEIDEILKACGGHYLPTEMTNPSPKAEEEEEEGDAIGRRRAANKPPVVDWKKIGAVAEAGVPGAAGVGGAAGRGRHLQVCAPPFTPPLLLHPHRHTRCHAHLIEASTRSEPASPVLMATRMRRGWPRPAPVGMLLFQFPPPLTVPAAVYSSHLRSQFTPHAHFLYIAFTPTFTPPTTVHTSFTPAFTPASARTRATQHRPTPPPTPLSTPQLPFTPPPPPDHTASKSISHFYSHRHSHADEDSQRRTMLSTAVLTLAYV